jgi:hypothetical protein
MEIVLHPQACPSDRIRIWVGALQTTVPPQLAWTLDGSPAQPGVLREIASVRGDDLLPAGVPPDQIERAFSGVYEFTGLSPDSLHTITAGTEDAGASIEVRTLPDAVTSELDRSFNVLLVSCFHADEDRSGIAGRIVSQLKAASKPHLTLLAGDQVYLDMPTLSDFPDDEVRLGEKFEGDYIRNWRGQTGYGVVLDAAPSVSVPDDHEYWNNYPHASPFIQNAWSHDGRERWRKAAQAVLSGFQLSTQKNVGDATVIEVPPLSFFLADTRSNRDPDRAFLMTDQQHEQLNDWVNKVVADGSFGVFVAGQSLFQEPTGAAKGAIADYELPNYGDYGRIVSTLQRLIDEGRRPFICLTGDVHWGRITTAQDITSGRTAITEIISSPSSLVSTLGFDTVNKVRGFVGGLFGKRKPWPRHPDTVEPPAFLASGTLAGRFPCSLVHSQKGNHIALLGFRQVGGGIECRVNYWPIHVDPNIATPIELGPFQLSSM